MSSFHRSPPMRTVKSPPRALIQKARRYLNWWDPRFSERFFSPMSRPGGRVCTPVSCVYIGACVCAPYVKCCVGSVTARAGHEPCLPYLPRISKYSYVTLAHERRGAYLYAHLQHAFVSDLTLVSVDGKMNVAGHGKERASDTRGACRSAGRRVQLPPVKPAGAVVPLCCGTLRRKGRINLVVTSR